MAECNDHLNCVRGKDVCGRYNEGYLNYLKERVNYELRKKVSSPKHPEYVSFAARIARKMASEPKHPEYASYAARLASFDRWPKAMSQTKETLATAGFYYTGDQTLCYYCGKGLFYWEPEDDPWIKHAKWFAYCPYLILIKGTEFVSSSASRTDIGAEKILLEINKLGENPEYVNFAARIARGMASNPKHSKYDSYAARLASFDRWPKAMSQTKETIATAGFYYTGSGNQTLCYHCGGGLRDWEPEDDPWVEHAKWFEYCPYLILTKGTEFVSSITGRTYVGAENILTQLINWCEKIEKDIDAESIASESSQNSIYSEETNTTEVSVVSGEASSEQQSVQDDEPCDKDMTGQFSVTSSSSRVMFDEEDKNGLVLCDKYLPVEVLIEIFCHADCKTLLRCQLVCKRWKMLMNHVWHKKTERTLGKPFPWNDQMPWTVYYLACTKKPYERNLVKNHSGAEYLDHWDITSTNFMWVESSVWTVEEPCSCRKCGVPKMPQTEPLFKDRQIYFKPETNFSCTKEQNIILTDEGIHPYILDTYQPPIEVSEWYHFPIDSSIAGYRLRVKLFRNDNTMIDEFVFRTGQKQSQWLKIAHAFKNYGPGLRRITFEHGGLHEARNYTKIAGACVCVRVPKNKI